MRSWGESALARALQWAVGTLSRGRASRRSSRRRASLSLVARVPCVCPGASVPSTRVHYTHPSERLVVDSLFALPLPASQLVGRPHGWHPPPARTRASFEFLFHPSIHPHGSVCRSHRPAKVVLHIPVARAPRRLPPRAPQEPKTVRPDLPKTLRRRFAKGTDPPRAPHPPVVASVVQEGAFPGSVQVQSTLEQDLFLQR